MSQNSPYLAIQQYKKENLTRQKDHFNKIQKGIKQHKRSLLKKRLRPMAEEGRGQRHSAPKGCPVAGQPFKSFDNASRRTKRQKGHCMELQGGDLFWFSPKFTRQKFSNRENFFQLARFCQQKFFRF